MPLQQRRRQTEHRPDTEIRHTVMDNFGTGHARPHRVDAEGRLQHMFEPEICGWESESTPALLAMRDMTFHGPPMPQETRRFAGLACPKRGANFGRGNLYAAGNDRAEDGHTKAFHLAHIAKHCDIAPASLAEAEILPHDDMGHGKLVHQ